MAYLVGPAFLGALMPRYAEGLPALRPLLPGMVLLGLAWPARQMLITIDRPYRLCLATLAGLAVLAVAGTLGADRAGIVGVAWGMSLGYAAVSALTSAHRLRPHARVAGLAGPSGSTGADPGLVRGRGRSSPRTSPIPFAARCAVLAAWSSPRSGSGAVDTPGEGSWIGPRRSDRDDLDPDEARMLDLGFVGLLTIWSAGVGLWTLRRLGPTPEHPADALALAVPLGLGLLAWRRSAWPSSRCLNRMGLAIVLALGAALGWRDAWSPCPAVGLAGRPRRGGGMAPRPALRGHRHPGGRGTLAGLRSPDLFVGLALLAAVLGTLLTALAPVTDGDALCYHLQVPKVFLSRGAAVFDPDLHETVYPLLTEMLYAVALAFRGPVACRLVQWVLGLVLRGERDGAGAAEPGASRVVGGGGGPARAGRLQRHGRPAERRRAGRLRHRRARGLGPLPRPALRPRRRPRRALRRPGPRRQVPRAGLAGLLGLAIVASSLDSVDRATSP